MRLISTKALDHGSDADPRHDISTADQGQAVPAVDLEQLQISELAVRLVPEKLARRHLVVPIRLDNRTLTYGTFQPFDGEAERDLSFAAGRQATSVFATRASVLSALDRLYPKLQELERIAGRLRAEGAKVETRARLTAESVPGASAVIDLCNQLIGRAVEVGASDIHIDCTSEGASVRFRVCGVLEPIMTLPATASHPVRNRFKIMAKADISVRFRPQDGSFRSTSTSADRHPACRRCRPSTRRKIVMRVIDSQSGL
jgi:type IV pilus assembly protein PilB